MSLSTEAQRRQITRCLPLPDGTIDASDRYVLTGTYETETTASPLSEDFRRQIARCLPAPDGSITAPDRYNIAHTYRSEVSTGPTIDLFSLEWSLEPAWTANLLPSSNDGFIATVLGNASSSFVGAFAAAEIPNVAVPPLPQKSAQNRPMSRRARRLDTIYIGEHNKGRKTKWD